MSEPTQPYITEEAPDEQAITARLARLLEPRSISELVDRLEKICNDPGFGEVTIIILKGRSIRFKSTTID
jgi:hypothetical protein